METLKFDLEKSYGKFKLMNCIGAGPFSEKTKKGFADARIPYARNHDLNLNECYGAPYCHDISAIFPKFDADPENAANYDFQNTDFDIARTYSVGTKVFFRLGQSIEHHVKKRHVYPPKDNFQWARICEHIIRHYTEGWANGFYYDMPYWEIWNEPDMAFEEPDLNKKATWCGTEEQFYDLYETAAKHLKKCFPHLKIGGPALSSRVPWAERFLCEMQKREVPIDFFSWHGYCFYPEKAMQKANDIQALMDRFGYGDAENILNEWNYIKAWKGPDYLYSSLVHINEKGAAFTMAYFTLAQKGPIDILMYYDARPSTYNGLFDYYTNERLKGYYPFYYFGQLYDCENEVRAEDPADIYSLCGVDKNGKVSAIITHFNDEDSTLPKEIKLDFGKPDGKFEAWLVDKEHTSEKINVPSGLTFTLDNNSVLFVKEA